MTVQDPSPAIKTWGLNLSPPTLLSDYENKTAIMLKVAIPYDFTKAALQFFRTPSPYFTWSLLINPCTLTVLVFITKAILLRFDCGV